MKPATAFTTCADASFTPGLFGLVRSIRRFHQDVDIWAFVEDVNEELEVFGKTWGVRYKTFEEIGPWVREEVYSKPRYQNDASHFYHPRFKEHIAAAGLPPYQDPPKAEFGIVHHLHPLNVKAYCTGWCLVQEKYENVLHIDCDAFLLGPVTQLFDEMPPDSLLGFDDGHQHMRHLKSLFGCSQNEAQEREHSLNAGIVFYRNGPGVDELMHDFMFYIDSCYHYSLTTNDQGLLRYLISKYHLGGRIAYQLRDRRNWNPVWSVADALRLEGSRWINEANGRQQFIWHGAGVAKPWQVKFNRSAVAESWRWVGGLELQDYALIPGHLSPLHCEKINSIYLSSVSDRTRPFRILEIGAFHGRTAIANCVVLARNGLRPEVCTLDVSEENVKRVRANALRYGHSTDVICHKVGAAENLLPRLTPGTFDACFIDGDHSFKQVLADIEVCKRAVRPGGLISGDDYLMPQVRAAVDLQFPRVTTYTKARSVGGLWWVENR
jgi:predicted O-methyltransferase YrrM